MKITIVGGGSTYTPELVDGLARQRYPLQIDELVLVDPDEERLSTVGGFAQRLLRRASHPAVLRWTSDLDDAVDGADVVVLQLRVGGQRARISDETIPLRHGLIGQETTGAGGFAKALRTVPVVLDIARRVRERAPEAWIVDFTNPVGIVTRALLDDGHRAVGLCNSAIGFQRHFADLLGAEPDSVQLDHVGLNHLTWERAVTVDGVDVLPQILAEHADALGRREGVPRRVIDTLGAVPSGYLRYFYAHDSVVEEQQRSGTRGHEVSAIEENLLSLYADPALDEIPDVLMQRGGAYYSEAALGLMASLLGGQPGVHILDVRNEGTLPSLPDQSVIEVPCRVDADGVHRQPCEPLVPETAGLVAHVAAYEDLTVQAAVHGGRDRAFRALFAHPLVGQATTAEAVTDEIIAANTGHLWWAR